MMNYFWCSKHVFFNGCVFLFAKFCNGFIPSSINFCQVGDKNGLLKSPIFVPSLWENKKKTWHQIWTKWGLWCVDTSLKKSKYLHCNVIFSLSYLPLSEKHMDLRYNYFWCHSLDSSPPKNWPGWIFRARAPFKLIIFK